MTAESQTWTEIGTVLKRPLNRKRSFTVLSFRPPLVAAFLVLEFQTKKIHTGSTAKKRPPSQQLPLPIFFLTIDI
jgi:hypothetical protein